jgi:methylated-DNA-[protein]-cysteine S-methyltransferase
VTSVSFATQPSPLGDLLLAASERGVCCIDWGDPDAAVARLEARFGATSDGSELLVSLADQLDEYFSAGRRDFSVPLDLSGETPFRRAVLERLSTVPFGDLISYGDLATEVGTSPRAVGGAVGNNPLPVVIPCHRVVAADGSLGGFGGGLERKRILLALEGRGGLPGGWLPRRGSRPLIGAARPSRVGGRGSEALVEG